MEEVLKTDFRIIIIKAFNVDNVVYWILVLHMYVEKKIYTVGGHVAIHLYLITR